MQRKLISTADAAATLRQSDRKAGWLGQSLNYEALMSYRHHDVQYLSTRLSATRKHSGVASTLKPPTNIDVMLMEGTMGKAKFSDELKREPTRQRSPKDENCNVANMLI